MTHRADVPPDIQRQRRRLRIVKGTAAGFTVGVLLIGGPALYTATEIDSGGPSPTRAIPAPEVPQLSTDRRSGELASVATTPRPDPAVEYEPEPAPVAVERVTPYHRPPTVVYVPVPPPCSGEKPGACPDVLPTPQYVAPEVAEPDRKADEAQRGEGGHKRHNDRGERDKRDKTTTPSTETDGTERPSEVCVVGVCVGDEQETETDPTSDSDADDRRSGETRDGDRSADRKKGDEKRGGDR